jgi:predicted dienelactone hydrolase
MPNHRLTALVISALLTLFIQPVLAKSTVFAMGSRQVSYVDESRPIKKSMGFDGAPTRRLDLHIWYPADGTSRSDPAMLAKGGPFPLVIYSHGTFGSADNAMHLVEHLVRHGYIVAAPDYPLTSSAAFTHVRFADISDVGQQTRDVKFIIDKLLADPVFGPAIDATKIGTTGHSLGAVTSYFTSFGTQTRDPRIAATALIAGGDPVESALMSDMGLLGTGHSPVRVPVLFLSAEHDVFARITGRPHASYSRVEGPKTEVMIKGGVHVWFRGKAEALAAGKNPDCLFFERMMPTMVMPGCETRGGLIDPARQQAITRAAVLDFFDGYLKRDASALERLRGLHREFKEADVISED